MRRIALIFSVLALVAGCAQSATEKPYGVPGSAVKPIGSGNIVYFNSKFESATASGQYIFDFDYDDVGTVTNNERVGRYLLAKGLMPPGCHNGIHIVRGGRGEYGKAWLIFKCQEKIANPEENTSRK